MIESRKELNQYLLEDSKNYGRIFNANSCSFGGMRKFLGTIVFSTPISDQRYIWKYIYALRHVEFYKNIGSHIRLAFWLSRLRKYSYKLSFQIPPNVFGPGLTIWHWGTIIINEETRIGKNCIIQPMVVIGQTKPGFVPIIGDNCCICSGVSIVGKVKIGNNVTVAPNAIVTKDIPDNCVVVGVNTILKRKM